MGFDRSFILHFPQFLTVGLYRAGRPFGLELHRTATDLSAADGDEVLFSKLYPFPCGFRRGIFLRRLWCVPRHCVPSTASLVQLGAADGSERILRFNYVIIEAIRLVCLTLFTAKCCDERPDVNNAARFMLLMKARLLTTICQ